jgi:chitin synthase
MLIIQLIAHTTSRIWAIWESGVYDLTDYINTVTINQGATSLYQFLSTDVSDVFKQQAGQDITKPLNAALAGLDSNTAAANINCLKNMFYLGETDFRDTPRCLVQNYLLLVFTSILCASIVLKCMSLSVSRSLFN